MQSLASRLLVLGVRSYKYSGLEKFISNNRIRPKEGVFTADEATQQESATSVNCLSIASFTFYILMYCVVLAFGDLFKYFDAYIVV